MTRSVEQEFVMNWTKMQSWASDNSIPKAALIPVYRMDAQRLLNGETPMGAGERYRAVLAAAKPGQVVTQIPTTDPSPTNVLGNTQHNLAQIFTGLNPIGLVKGIVDTVKNTILHPATTIEALTTVKKFEGLSTHPTKSLISWLPGLTDLGELAKGKSGLDYLATHPISALLDIMPVDRLPDVFLAGATGEKMAEILGTTVTDLRSAGGSPGLRALARVAMKKELKMAGVTIGYDSEGNIIRAQMTVEDAWNQFSRRHHFGKEASTLTYQALEIGQSKTNEAMRLLMPLDKQMQALSTAERLEMVKVLTLSGKSYADIDADDSISLGVRKAIQLYQPLENWLEEQAIGTGKVVKVRMPTGREELYSAQVGNKILDKTSKIEQAQTDFMDQFQQVSVLTDAAHALDITIDKRMLTLDKMRSDTWEHVTATLPTDNDEISDTLRQALTPATRWSTTPKFRNDRIRRVYTGEDPRWHSPAVRKLFNIGEGSTVNVSSIRDILKSHANIIRDVFSPGGLIDQLKKARADGDFAGFTKLARQLNRKLSGRFAMEMKVYSAPDLFDQIRNMSNELTDMGSQRNSLEKQIMDKSEGITAKGKKSSLAYKFKVYNDLKDSLERYIWEKPGLSDELHIPARYQPVFEKIYAQKLADSEQARAIAESGFEELKKMGYTSKALDAIRADKQRIFEMVSLFANSTFDDPLVGSAFLGVKEEVMRSAINEVKELYARGTIFHYVPKITPYELKDEGFDTYNVFVKTDRIPTPSQVFQRTWDFGSTVHNFMASVSHAVKDQLQHDGTIEFVSQAIKLGYNKDLVDRMIASDPEYRLRFAGMEGDPTFNVGAVRDQIYKELNLIQWNPDQVFNIKLPRSIGDSDSILMPKDLIDTIRMITDRAQFPMTGLFDKGTQLFRFSILGLSPRYTAHILFGGSYLVALRLRNPIHLFTMIPNAYRAAKDGILPDEISDKVFTQMTQYGNADVTFHYRSGVTGGRVMIEEKLAKLGINPKAATIVDRLNAVAHLNYTFTHFVANMQRALVFLDGASKIAGLEDIVDEDGNLIHDVTSDRALYEGLKAVDKVMGDVRRMSPFERAWLTRAFPFWGWTKHILKYVMSYPFDHPLRASILSNLAMMNTNNVTKGLDMRIQLMFFLGSPTPEGTVSGVTVRALDPLRTTANYASIAGWLSSLNPLIVAPFVSVDPNLTFGTNELYPTISYNDIYGVEQANASSNFGLAALEQIIPQSTAAAELLGLGTYRQLRKNDPAAFEKAIYESLNVPFLEVQHLNLKQMAAKNEDDRYEQAKQAATKALQTGTFAALKGYKTVPYPLNDVYDITPAQLEALYNASMSEYGLGPEQTMVAPKSPLGL